MKDIEKNARNDDLIVVTGASRGIGREIVLDLIANGHTVLAIARNGEQLGSIRDEINGTGELIILSVDLAEPNSTVTVKKAVAGRGVRALIHNAGVLHNKPMGAHEHKDLAELYKVNVFAPLELSQALVEELKGDPPGHIVHIGSMGGFQDSSKFPGLVAYSASKAALACIAQCLAEEFKDIGIRSNCLALGSVDTDMLRAAFPGSQAPISAAAMGRYISWFALEGHNYYNGKVLPVAVSTP
ncbi:MAG: SDR family oxidoreductase [Flavobacteriales bacterium]|nr:SDR family oxidoreductase [Flavobacteriales bacterium]MBK6943398.1 SDR family oxidoreductase [Flavobacteriales bacterium]MBK7240721.1 SDR family oxidoreductase [Flavobacteriales bacterium]MBK7298435.1 SDR family oxidoreductase [Flavobacteriales bacterium]MBK9536069.1 SDR family oxidoreductase [Flavobacteriales bacterium]